MLDQQFLLTSQQLFYGIACKIQKYKQEPNPKKQEDPTFPGLKLTVGFANKSNKVEFKKVQEKRQQTNFFEIDYSFNEFTYKPETALISNSSDPLIVYSLTDLVSEKFRSIFQQKVRKRTRRQDIYDLFYLLSNFRQELDTLKPPILETLKKKSEERLKDFPVTQNSLGDADVIRRSQQEYPSLETEIDGILPKFSLAYGLIEEYYRSLPW